MRRELGQLSLADGLVDGGAGRNRQLEKIAALVDWAAFERLLGEVYAAPVGRPSYGPVVVMKCLLLQQWYRLSDPGLEEALADRRSFRRFVGLALADPVPDHSTLSRFRTELSRRGLAEQLLAELNRQLDAQGLMVKSGTLIDASLVEADCRRPRKGEPLERRSDRDASWNAMPEKPLFGYKMHLAVDQGSGLVRRAMLTPGHVSDKVPFLDLVQGDERAVYADRGYDGWWYRRELARRGIADGIMAGDYRQRPLHATGHACNRALAALRRPIERTFAILKRWYGYGRVRYRSVVQNGRACRPWSTPAWQAFGRIDVLVNNVGIARVGGIVSTEEADWDLVTEVNQKSMYLVCRQVAPIMERQGSGAIVNIASVAAHRWTGISYASYYATKGAVVALSRAIALEFAGKGIRCNSVSPGLMDTPMVRYGLTGAYGKDGDVDNLIGIRTSQCPMGHMGTGWDTAHAVLFLASDEAKYITGIDLIVDGGLTAKFA